MRCTLGRLPGWLPGASDPAFLPCMPCMPFRCQKSHEYSPEEPNSPWIANRSDTMRPSTFLLLLACAGLVMSAWASNAAGGCTAPLLPPSTYGLCERRRWRQTQSAHAWGHDGWLLPTSRGDSSKARSLWDEISRVCLDYAPPTRRPFSLLFEPGCRMPHC